MDAIKTNPVEQNGLMLSNLRATAESLRAKGENKAAQELDNLTEAYLFLASEYATVLTQAGWSESVELAEKDAISWIDPAKRPTKDS